MCYRHEIVEQWCSECSMLRGVFITLGVALSSDDWSFPLSGFGDIYSVQLSVTPTDERIR